MSSSIGWIGLGGMGSGMAALVCRHLHTTSDGHLLVYNRTQSKVQDFIKQQHPGTAVAATHPQDLATSCPITFSCLANDDALKAVVHTFLSDLRCSSDTPHRIFVDCSTVLPSTTRHLAAIAAEHNVSFIHAPVFGRPDAANAGRLLSYISGGTEDDRKVVAEIAGASYAQNGTHDLGDDVTASSSMKLVGNAYIIGQVTIAAQCLTLGAKSNLPNTKVLELLQYINGNAPIPSGYARRIATGDYEAGQGFTVDLAMKDVSHMQTLGREVACPVPLCDVAMQSLSSAKAKFGGHLDWGAIHLAMRDAAGLAPNIKGGTAATTQS